MFISLRKPVFTRLSLTVACVKDPASDSNWLRSSFIFMLSVVISVTAVSYDRSWQVFLHKQQCRDCTDR